MEEEQSVFFLACTEKRSQREEACLTPSWKQAFILPDNLGDSIYSNFQWLRQRMALNWILTTRRHRSGQAPTYCELGKPCISDHLQAPNSPMFVVLLSYRASATLNRPH